MIFFEPGHSNSTSLGTVSVHFSNLLIACKNGLHEWLARMAQEDGPRRWSRKIAQKGFKRVTHEGGIGGWLRRVAWEGGPRERS